MLTNAYRDRWGLPFDEVRLWLPARVADWPTPPRVKVDRDGEMARFHAEFKGKQCWMCDDVGMELHHLAGGRHGRTHERFVFTWLCKTCHENRVRVVDLGRLLHAKWLHDRDGLDWVRLAIRLGRHLPDLVPGN